MTEKCVFNCGRVARWHPDYAAFISGETPAMCGHCSSIVLRVVAGVDHRGDTAAVMKEKLAHKEDE